MDSTKNATAPLLDRALSNRYGEGASAYTAEALEEWRNCGQEAVAALKQKDWIAAHELARRSCMLRPDWPKGYLLLRLVMEGLETDEADVETMLKCGLSTCEVAGRSAELCVQLGQALVSLQRRLSEESLGAPSGRQHGCSDSSADPADEDCPVEPPFKVKGVKLLPHEQELVNAGALRDVTHKRASAIWLTAKSLCPPDDMLEVVYRPMGDLECAHLLVHGELPATQPYQTIVRGEAGRCYAEKYLRGHKMVDSSPTTVVEFLAPRSMIDTLFAKQSKNEDGAISHGLGNKGGNGLPLFNTTLHEGKTTFRLVAIKRFERKAVGAFGAGRRKL